MLVTSETQPTATPFTTAQRTDAWVQHTADLDKAEVLQKSIPPWLADAELSVVQALKTAFEQSDRTYTKAATVLAKLTPLDRFCKDQLTSFLKQKWTIEVDVERDSLDIIEKQISSNLFPFGYEVGEKVSARSLVHAAMDNFAPAQAQSGGIPKDSVIRINGRAQTGTDITPQNFAGLCRELDLGARYQRHIADILALPSSVPTVPTVPTAQTAQAAQTSAPADEPASANDIRRLKLLDMTVAVHIAHLKKHITPAVYTMLLSVIAQDLPAEQTRAARFNGEPVIWQDLMIHDACVCGALVFSTASIDSQPTAGCVVYLPNDPERPLYEYASLADFKTHLTQQLQTKRYRAYFASQFLPGHDKGDFFSAFDLDKSLGTLSATAAGCLGDFLFGAFVSKAQQDAAVLAVTTAEVDEEQREKTLQQLLEGGLLLLNAASFFVPVLGELMLAVAVVDIVSEVYEGVQDWAHGERHGALRHLLNVLENVAQMAAFAVAGKAVSAVLNSKVKQSTVFFDHYQAVTRTDGTLRLWKPDLEPYKQKLPLLQTLQPDAKGLYKEGERTSVRLDDAAYDVSHDATLQRWRINHPVRPEAFKPAIERNVEGGWRHVFEHAHEWPDSGYAMKRTAPRLDVFSERQLTHIANLTGVTPAELFRLHDSGLTFPPRLTDCIERFQLDQRITRMITAMKAAETANTEFVQEQLHTLPRLPGWPAKRFIEVRDEHGATVSHFPDTASLDDEVNSVRVTQAQLGAGKLLDTVVDGLYAEQVRALVGTTTAQSPAQLLTHKIAASLESDRRPLHEWLYKNYDGPPTGDVATLRETATDLPTRVAQHVLDSATNKDRLFLRDRRIPGLGLAEQVRRVQSTLTLDRALTGLHLPSLASADTDTLALRLLDQLQGWDNGFRLELRQNSSTGTLLDSVGKTQAPVTGLIVKTVEGYQVTQRTGTLLTTRTSTTLTEAILQALPAAQRSKMGLSGADNLDTLLLRERLVGVATANPSRTARVLRGEQSEGAAYLSACAQADPAVATVYAKALVCKVRRLYPLFSDAEVSAFLDQAGSSDLQRANRIKALQQQWKKLRSALHSWRDDQVQMKKLPGAYNDVRISRRQVATAIENCWRRIKPPLWQHDQPYTTLKLERSPVGELPTLSEQDVAHVRTLIVKDMEAGDELAYFLRPFKALTRLELDGNQLTRLPEALSHMVDLEHLSLNRNKLALTEFTLRKLAGMRHLKSLALSGNRLGATLDLRKMFDLQSLFLNDTHSTELPLGLSALPYLDIVDLRGNEIRELPAWLFQVPRGFARRVNLRHNPLSTASRAKLKSYRDKTGVGMGFLEDDVAVINEQRARDLWMPDARETNYASRNNTWTALKNEPESDGFFRLLAEVGSTADSRYVHEDMTRRVWNVIDAAQADASLREVLLPLAVKANCDDSAATIFSHLEVAVDIDALVRQSANAHDQAARLLKLGRSLFRQDYLARLAAEHALADPKLDPVEVELAYRTGLAERLELIGQPRHMRFASLAGVKTADLELAYNKVVTAEISAEFLSDLTSRTFWREFLREHHAERFTALAAPFHQRLETAFDDQLNLGATYRGHVDGIAEELEQAQTALLKTLTEDAMKADDLQTCFALD